MISLLACTSDEPPAEELIANASGDVTWESTALLGPHHYAATVTTTRWDRPTTEGIDVLWADWDNLEVERRRDGEVATRLTIVEGEVWQGNDDRMRRAENVELYRRELATTWNLYQDALRPFAGHVEMTKTGETVVEGRPALVYSLALEADPQVTGRIQPTALVGTVTVDEGTAVRLLADVTGTAVDDKGVERTVHVALTRSEIGQVPEILPPTNTGPVRPGSP